MADWDKHTHPSDETIQVSTLTNQTQDGPGDRLSQDVSTNPPQDITISTQREIICRKEPSNCQGVELTNVQGDVVTGSMNILVAGDTVTQSKQYIDNSEVIQILEKVQDTVNEEGSFEEISDTDAVEDFTDSINDIADQVDDITDQEDDIIDQEGDIIDQEDDDITDKKGNIQDIVEDLSDPVCMVSEKAQDMTQDMISQDIVNRPGSLPLIHVSGDHNANTIMDHKWSVSNPLMHLVPRREGRIVLPKRYMDSLNAYKQKQEALNQSPRESPSSQDSPVYTEVHVEDRSDHCNNKTTEDYVYSRSPTRSTGDKCTNKRSPGSISPGVDNVVSSKWSDRIGDLDVALKWIRQEVLQIKQEDRFLTRRLLDLRARIHQIQGLPSHLSLSSNLAFLGSCGSDMDVATWSSFLSLDETALRRSSEFSDNPTALKELLLSFQQERNGEFNKPNTGTLGRGLRGFGTASGLGCDTLSRSASTREPIRPPPRKRKNSLPMANELEEDHFFDEDDSD